MNETLFIATGKNMSAKVVSARGIEGKIGYFEVMFEYSRPKDIWFYHTDTKGQMKVFHTLANAKAAAKRIIW